MLVPLRNTPRDYEWGSTTLLADLEQRQASGRPEAEVWFGAHPGSPATVPDGRPLSVWLGDEGAAAGAPRTLPFLVKLLAAASSLSIQAHPSKAQAVAGFEREESVGVPREAPDRVYRDDNHKPELIVAISDTFRALAGLREVDETRRLLNGLGTAGESLAAHLAGPDAAEALHETIAWLLSGNAQVEVDAIIAAAAAAAAAAAEEFADELELVDRLAVDFPGDPGVVIALLMNFVTLRRGEALFVPAGVLHSYQDGLGIELMAASDNVLRGGLTPKHIDVTELLRVLDSTPGPASVIQPDFVGDGILHYRADVPDFAMSRATATRDGPLSMPVTGPAIAVATAGTVELVGAASGQSVTLTPGQAALVTPDEGRLRVSGAGEVFIAQPGAASPADSTS